MPYKENTDLPKSVRDSLPEHAQTIYRKAYNSAAKQYPDYDEERLAKISWAAVKKVYKKKDGEWTRADLFGAEVPPDSYSSETHIVTAIKVGTVAHTSYGEPYTCTADWLEAHAGDWTNGSLIANHNGENSEKFGSILRSWFEHPFVKMEIGNMTEDAERRMLAGEHTGFSFDAVGDPYYPDNVQGTNLSILFFPHSPACSVEEGCGLAAEAGRESLQSHNLEADVKPKEIINGSEAMAEDRTYTNAEIEQIKEGAAITAAKLATFEADAKTHDSAVDALKAEIVERSDKISEMTEKAGEMFSAEDVEAKVAEAKGAMFSAEDVETAKAEAIEAAIAAEKERTEVISAELDAVNKMFPDGLDAEFRETIVAMIMEGKTHEALVKIGEIEYKELKANIPGGASGTSGTTEPTNGFTVGDCKGA